MKTQKPYQPTILRRKTARNLSYLLKHGLIATMELSKFLMPHRFRIVDGKPVPFTDKSPTHGV